MGDDIGELFEPFVLLAEPSFPLFAVGHVVEDDDVALCDLELIGHRRHLDVVDLLCTTVGPLREFGRLGPPLDGGADRVGELSGVEAVERLLAGESVDDPLGGLVGVDDLVVGVQDQHWIGHLAEKPIGCDRCDLQKVVSVKCDTDDDRLKDEEDRRDIQLGMEPELAHEQHCRDRDDDGRQEDCPCLVPVEVPCAPHKPPQ